MKTIGILGGGQLAQLLAHSAYSLGLETLAYTEVAEVPARRNSPLFLGALSDQEALRAFAEKVDVITIETENIPLSVLEFLSTLKPVHPSINSVRTAQDRLFEKTAFKHLNIPVPQFFAVDSSVQLQQGMMQLKGPGILKTRRMGYDGKGQARVDRIDNTPQVFESLGSVPCILEEKVNFDFEVSQLAARRPNGDMIFYPLCLNRHEQGILRETIFPYVDPALSSQAREAIARLMTHLNYVGLMAFEFFVVKGQLLANEIAPRVHNSGHVTLEATPQASQFENHLRAILDWPLIEPVASDSWKMINIIGQFEKSLPSHGHVYHYGKSERPGRKLGHLTVRA